MGKLKNRGNTKWVISQWRVGGIEISLINYKIYFRYS